MRRDLGLLVVAQLDAVRGGQAGRLAPDGRAACPRGVEVADVDGAVRDEVPDAVQGRLALAGGDGDARLEAHIAHPAPVVGPAAGLLEPAQVEVGDEAPELDGLGPLVALVGVDHDGEVGTGRLTGRADAPRVLLRRPAADLELDAREPRRVVRDELPGLVQVQVVVAADDGHRQRVGDRAPQPMERQADGLAEDVPDGRVEARDRLERQAAVAQDVVGGRLHGRPGALRVGRAATDDPGRQLVVDDADDKRLLVVRVAVVDLGHQAVRRVQAGDDGGPVDHRVGAADEPSGERRPQRDGLDALDPERAPVERS